METVKEYVQTYPLDRFPILQDFYNNLLLYAKERNEIWGLIIDNSLKQGLKVICRILNKQDNGDQTYEAYVTLIDGPINDLFYIGFSHKETERDIANMLEEYSDSIFGIEGWDKESIQKFFIDRLLEGDYESI